MLGKAIQHYLRLKKSQWWPREQLLKMQFLRAKALFEHSYENVPLYREKFDKARIKPSDINRFSDFQKIPITTRDELRDTYEGKWFAENIDISNCKETVTSGSTGNPLKFLLDKNSVAFRFGLNLRTLELSTYKLGKKLFQVSPALSDKVDSNFKKKLIDGLLRRMIIPPFEKDIENKLNKLIGFGPKAIVGYTSYIKSLADTANDLNINIEIPTIMTTSEMLLPQTRQKLIDTFKGKVFDQYGSVETGRTAAECGMGDGYHINVEGVLIEILNEEGVHAKEGETGRLVATNLMNYVNPFIRYELGDFASFSMAKCSCGRELPLIKEIAGRLNDVIKLPDGKKIMPEYFYLTLRPIKGLSQFQVVQEDPSTLNISYTCERDFDIAGLSKVKEEYDKYFKDINITWNKVQSFKKIAGKHKHIKSYRKAD